MDILTKSTVYPNDILRQRSHLIRKRAFELGFLSCGFAKAEFLENDAPRLEKWLQEGKHGKMSYMENHFDKRLDPRLLVDGAKTVVSLMYNYYPHKQQNQNSYKIAKYAYGKDYHYVVKEKLNELFEFIKDEFGEVGGRAFSDSAPIMEHAWAEKSGIGWVGKNSLTLSKQHGSFFFLSELILDLELAYDSQMTTDHCGTCTRCMDACPTQAILPGKRVDGSKCISYFTIELKEEIPTEMSGKFGEWIFGCDICQDICPWNRFSLPTQDQQFQPVEELLNYSKKDWEELNQETFNQIFKKSPVKRAKFEGLKRNIKFVSPKQ